MPATPIATAMTELDHKCHFFHLSNVVEKEQLEDLKARLSCAVYDSLPSQLSDLIKLSHPERKFKPEELQELVLHRAGPDPDAYGVWVYYPWTSRLVHLLDEAEFAMVRTNRNKLKITEEQQELLAGKRIGIMGLSVGQSVALTLALERSFGELRLADYDTLDLSNLNRLRAGIHELGINKAIIAARQIAEIDPFINVTCFTDGISDENIDDFFLKNGKLDLLIEECDSLDIKIRARHKARELRIPVLMDTSDRGMMDVERFDTEPNRPVLHGLAGDLDPASLKGLTNEEKVPYVMQMIGAEKISAILKASMVEVEQSIYTWPQLASSVTLGGALVADVARRLLLGENIASGRTYVDLDQLIPSERSEASDEHHKNPYQPLELEALRQKVLGFTFTKETELSADQLSAIMKAAHAAPSAGNNQPWKWVAHDSVLYLFHDRYRSFSWGDYNSGGATVALGAAVENVNLKAAELGLEAVIQWLPLKEERDLVAVISFKKSAQNDKELVDLAREIPNRITNRMNGPRVELPASFLPAMKEVMQGVGNVSIDFITDPELMRRMGEVIAACDRLRLLYLPGHEEFYSELRWSEEEAKRRGDGIDLALVDLTPGERAGIRMTSDKEVPRLLQEWNRGMAFKKLSRKAVEGASALGIVSVPAYNQEALLEAGRSVERGWLYATQQQVAFYPMLSTVFFFNRMMQGGIDQMPDWMIRELKTLRVEYENITGTNRLGVEAFLFKLAIAPKPHGRTYRLPFNDVILLD